MLTIHDSRAKFREFLNLRPCHWRELARLLKHPNFRARMIPVSLMKRMLGKKFVTGADVSWLNMQRS